MPAYNAAGRDQTFQGEQMKVGDLVTLTSRKQYGAQAWVNQYSGKLGIVLEISDKLVRVEWEDGNWNALYCDRLKNVFE
jgi:ribosomal protein L21E